MPDIFFESADGFEANIVDVTPPQIKPRANKSFRVSDLSLKTNPDIKLPRIGDKEIIKWSCCFKKVYNSFHKKRLIKPLTKPLLKKYKRKPKNYRLVEDKKVFESEIVSVSSYEDKSTMEMCVSVQMKCTEIK